MIATKQFRNGKDSFSWKKTNWGLTNEIFLLNDEYILRRAKISNPLNDYQQEIKILTLIAEQEISVPLLDYGVTDKFFYSVMRYIPELQSGRSEKLTPSILLKIAKLIKKLHQIQVPKKHHIKKIDLISNLKLHVKLVEKLITPDVRSYLKKTLDFLSNGKIQNGVLSHNDLVRENFIFTKNKNYLIDYEYGGLNSHYYDIACFISESNLGNQPNLGETGMQIFEIQTRKTIEIIHYLIMYRLLIGYLGASYMLITEKKIVYQKLQKHKNAEINDFGNKILNHC